MIYLCIPTYKRFDLLKNCVDSALAGSVKPHFIHIIDTSGGNLPEDIFTEPEYEDVDITVFNPCQRISLGLAWNLLIDSVPYNHIPLICNDDIEFNTESVERMLTHIEHGSVCFGLTGKNRFSLFSLDHITWASVGMFDHEFFPAYFEDTDFGYRLKILNVNEIYVDSKVKHLGSATINSYTPKEQEEHRLQFIANENRYIAKWGGKPGEERFTHPFSTTEYVLLSEGNESTLFTEQEV